MGLDWRHTHRHAHTRTHTRTHTTPFYSFPPSPSSTNIPSIGYTRCNSLPFTSNFIPNLPNSMFTLNLKQLFPSGSIYTFSSCPLTCPHFPSCNALNTNVSPFRPFLS